MVRVTDLATGYGDLEVVHEVGFSVRPGELTAILGRNGAGKTSTLRAVAGLNRVFRGTVEFDGADITRMSAHERVRRGLAYVQEGKRVFHDLSVEQNLLLGGFATRRRRRVLRQEAERMYEFFPILGEKRRDPAGSMSGGQQQMLAIGQALMSVSKVLLLDEPSGGLAPVIVQEVMSRVAALKETGIGIVLVEQAVEAAMDVADSVVVLDLGRVALSADAAEVDDIELLRDAYFGRQRDRARESPLPVDEA